MLIQYKGERFHVSEMQFETIEELGGDAFAVYTVLTNLGYQVIPPAVSYCQRFWNRFAELHA